MQSILRDTVSNTSAVVPDARGRFGAYGGRYVPETLVPALDELSQAYQHSRQDAAFQADLARLLSTYVGRPTPLTLAERLTRHAGGARIYLKREDLAHGGAHKINNAIAQGLLARWMGKKRVVAETGAGQHGVATAMVAALFDLQCVVYMGTEDMQRQAPNVQRMRLLGAEVRPVASGSCTLKDAINEAIRDWVTNVRDTHYLLGSVVGPHPYPMMVRDFQAVIGQEARQQILAAEGRLPDVLVACVGGGSNAMGLFHAFRDDRVRLVGVEAGGHGIASGEHAARFADPQRAHPGVLQGAQSLLLQDADGQVLPTHSISAGLDHAAVGPEHVYLRDLGRAEYTFATDDQALAAFHLLCRLEGIIPALESAHALVEAVRLAPDLGPGGIIVVNLSGRGDKDLQTVESASVRAGEGHLPPPNEDYIVRGGDLSPESDANAPEPSGAAYVHVPRQAAPRTAGAACRVSETFRAVKAQGRAALLPYLMLGYPDAAVSLATARAILDAGADGLELGIPFSDPLADGPVIQHAGDVALRKGMNVSRALDLIAQLRDSHQAAPFFLMGYLNPLLAYGLERLCRDASAAGVDGLIVPDLPPEEDGALLDAATATGLMLIHFLAPTSSQERIKTVAARSQGMLYLVSLTGVTGARQALPAGLADFVGRVRQATGLPLAVGFGIATPEQARAVGRLADGVIVGSALVERIGNGGLAGAVDLVAALRAALEKA